MVWNASDPLGDPVGFCSIVSLMIVNLSSIPLSPPPPPFRLHHLTPKLLRYFVSELALVSPHSSSSYISKPEFRKIACYTHT